MPSKRKYNAWLTPRQLAGACLFLLLVAGIGVLIALVHNALEMPSDNSDWVLTQQKAQELESRLKESRYDTFPQRTYYRKDTVALCLQPFDPNTADSLVFRQLGLPAWMAKNVLAYRASGGIFRTKEAFRKVYGMTDERYAALEPYIRIDTALLPPKPVFASVAREKKDTVLDLNACDTASLQLIRGIGRYTALQIVRYRQQLGGYVSVEQLREIETISNSADTLMPHFIVCTDSVRPLQVNRLRTERLQRHPYLSFTQAKALYELRREHFRLHSMDDLQELDCFSPSDLIRLRPYLSFEE